MSRGQKFIKSLEVVAILILVISFIVLAYCIYISVNMEMLKLLLLFFVVLLDMRNKTIQMAD